MIIINLSDAIELRNSRAQPNLWFTPYLVPKRLRDIHSKFFPDIPHHVDVYSVNRGPLACICESDSSAGHESSKTARGDLVGAHPSSTLVAAR